MNVPSDCGRPCLTGERIHLSLYLDFCRRSHHSKGLAKKGRQANSLQGPDIPYLELHRFLRLEMRPWDLEFLSCCGWHFWCCQLSLTIGQNLGIRLPIKDGLASTLSSPSCTISHCHTQSCNIVLLAKIQYGCYQENYGCSGPRHEAYVCNTTTGRFHPNSNYFRLVLRRFEWQGSYVSKGRFSQSMLWVTVLRFPLLSTIFNNSF